MKPVQRRSTILSAAKHVFARRGYHEASVDDIIRKAGIARGTFYLYFEGKREIFASLLGDLMDELRQKVKPVALGPGQSDPIAQVTDNVARVLETFRGDPELTRLLLHEAGALDAESRTALRRFVDHVRDMIERSLHHGMRLGIVRDCDVEVASACILGCVREVVETLVAGTKRKPIRAIAEEVVKFGLSGVLASGNG